MTTVPVNITLSLLPLMHREFFSVQAATSHAGGDKRVGGNHTNYLLRDLSISFVKEASISSIFACICLTRDSTVKAFVMGFSASLLAISMASLVVLRWKICSSSSISLSCMRGVWFPGGEGETEDARSVLISKDSLRAPK